jgi:hypothetical protein
MYKTAKSQINSAVVFPPTEYAYKISSTFVYTLEYYKNNIAKTSENELNNKPNTV